MPETIISNTSCLIVLSNIGELALLEKLYKTVITTPEVSREFGETLPGWVEIKEPTDKKYQRLLELSLDAGEASVIALATEMESSVLILDDHKARKMAYQLKLKYTGTLGVILGAKKADK